MGQEEIIMNFYYNGLWEVMIASRIKTKKMIYRTGILPTTMSKICIGEAVSLSVIEKICKELGADTRNLICIDKDREDDK